MGHRKNTVPRLSPVYIKKMCTHCGDVWRYRSNSLYCSQCGHPLHSIRKTNELLGYPELEAKSRLRRNHELVMRKGGNGFGGYYPSAFRKEKKDGNVH